MEAGALDGLSLEEVKKMAPVAGDYILVTLMRDRTPVIIGKSHILPRMQNCIDDLAKEGVELIVLLCTGELPEFASEKIIVRPDRLVNSVIRGILPEGTLGVVVPLSDQIPQLSHKWVSLGLKVIVESVTPYGARDEITSVAKKLASQSVDLVILDCIGYNLKMKETMRKIMRKPVILSRSILARTVKELLD